MTTKTILQRFLLPGPSLVCLAVVTTLIVVVCGISAVQRLNQPFPGFFVWENLFVPAVGEPSWTGVSSGLVYQSWVNQVDGDEVDNAREFEDALRGRGVGDSVSYGLEKDGESYEITVEFMRLGLRPWVSVLGIYVFDAVVLLILGVVVMYMKPHDPASRALFLFCADLGLYIATSADAFGPYLFRIPYFYSINLFPVATLHLLSHFPVARRRRDYESVVLAILAVIGLLHGTASSIAFHSSRRVLILLETATHTLLATVGVIAIVFFGWHFVATRSRIVRDRMKVVLLGTIAAFILPVVMLFLIYVRGVEFPFNFLTLFFVLFPLAIGYAIAKHDLFNIDRVIKRTLVYATLSTVILATYLASVGAFDYLFEVNVVQSRLAEGVLIMSLIVVMNPIRTRIQGVVDRVYDRRRYDYGDVVRTTSKRFATILDSDELVRAVLLLIDETIQPVMAGIYSIEGDGQVILIGRVDHRAGTGAEPEIRVRRTAMISLSPTVLALRGSEIATVDDEAFTASAAALRDVGGSLAVPMSLEGRLLGMIVVGRRRSGGHIGTDDIDLLRTVCDQLSVALENATAYGKIDSLARGLESKNVELETANVELRETQEALVRQERLAAIGQLAGAVAHAIRNPLAGIKAAAQLGSMEAGGDEGGSAFGDIVEETDRLNERITALLEFSRPFEPDMRPCGLNGLAETVVAVSSAKAAQRGVELCLHALSEDCPLEIDPIMIEQVIVELVANAIDASPDDGVVAVRIGVASDDGPDYAWIEVEDSGAGVAEDKAARIFDLFFTSKETGTGFGLATVKKIVERHGGDVSVENGESGGACFTVKLPLIRTAV